MSFFRKLKQRLFKSSSRIEEGLEAIVEEGGDEAELLPEDSGLEEAAGGKEIVKVPMPTAPPVAEIREVPPAVDPLLADDLPPPEPEAAPEPAPKAEPAPEPEAGAEAGAGAGTEAEPAPRVEPEQKPTPEIAPKAEPEPAPEAGSPCAPAPGGEAEASPAPAPAPSPAPAPARPPAAAPEAGAGARAEKEAEPEAETEAEAEAEARKPGFLGRLLKRAAPRAARRRVLDDEMLEQLEELLISADMGVETAMRVTANMAEGRFGRKLSVEEIKRLLAGEIARIMEPVARPLPLYGKRPQVVLVVGVNGSGKTTTIGKLAAQFREAGKKVIIAAGDTFRAAAVEQLQIWGERAGVPVLTAPEGSDPASLAFDAMAKAEAEGADLLLIDTAGRLQNRRDLMEELAKIVRVIRKKDPDAPHNTILVLDATTGQNALSQVEVFREISDVSGLIMTKLDGTARGGVLVALADRFGLPIHAIGVGEQIDDLAPFDPEEFAAALTGLEE